jgi:nitric oxide reductase NorQ protein
MTAKCSLSKKLPVKDHLIGEKPYYVPMGDEVEIFPAACRNLLPIDLKGYTC